MPIKDKNTGKAEKVYTYPSFVERRLKGQEFRKKIEQCTDPAERHRLEYELSHKYHVDHYTIPKQPKWPLHDWPWTGPRPVDEPPPKSHYIRAKYIGKPERYGWLNRSYAIEKYARTFETFPRYSKLNTPRAIVQVAILLFIPYVVYRGLVYEQQCQQARAGHLDYYHGVKLFQWHTNN